MAEFNMNQFEQDYRNERREALRDSVKSGKTSLPVGILQYGVNRLGEGVSDTVQGIGAFAKSLYNNPQAVVESGAEGLEALYNRVAQGDPMAAMQVAQMVASGGTGAAILRGGRIDPSAVGSGGGNIIRGFHSTRKDFDEIDPERGLPTGNFGQAAYFSESNDYPSRLNPNSRIIEADLDTTDFLQAGKKIPVAKERVLGTLSVLNSLEDATGKPFKVEYDADTNTALVEYNRRRRAGEEGPIKETKTFDFNDSSKLFDDIKSVTWGLRYESMSTDRTNLSDFMKAAGFTGVKGGSDDDFHIGVFDKSAVKQFAQGGPVMRGIGTLNETARNMFRGPRGIGAYQQFADGGPAQNDLNRLNTLFENAPSNNFTLTEAPFVFMPNESELSALERERLESTYGGDNRYVFEQKKLPISGTIQYQKNRDGSKRFDAEIEKKFKGELGSITPSARYSTQRSSKRSGNIIVDETGRQVGFAVEGEIYIDPDSENKLKGAIDVENSKKSRSFTIPEGQILKTEDGTLLKKFNLGVDLGSLGLDATYFDDSKKGTRAEGSATIKIGDNGIIKYNDSSDGRPTFSAKYATDLGDGEASLNYENDLRNVPRYGAELNTKFGEGVGSLSYRNDGRGNTFGAKYNITFASGGEVSGPPPTRGPDPQGIGYFQQFADGGPVYMNNGGEGSVERIKDGILQTVFDVESNGDFNRWHDDAQNIPETPLTQMTVSEIMGYQRGENGPAAGAGQIKFNTFQYLLDTGTLNPDEVFSPQVQRKAHSRLLDRRGFNEWVQGELSNDGFIQRLAREYAAIPLAQDEQVGKTLRESGKSRYGGSNAHRISLDNMRNVLTSLKSPSMASEAALDEAMYAADYLEPQTMPSFAEPEEAGPDLIDAQSFDSGVGSMMPPTTGEELRQGFRPRFGSPAQEDDYMSMVPQKISMQDKYSTENIAADLVGGEEALEEGIGGLKESLRPKLRPSEIEFGEDKGGVFRSLMPPRRKQKEYPRNDPDALFRGLGKIRGRTLRKGFTPYVQDVRGELT